MLKYAFLVISTTLISGCASTLGTFFNRPVVEDSIQDAVSTVSLAADRRTVVVVTEGPNRTKFCAEPPPDTAIGLKTQLDTALEAKAKKAEAEGKFSLKDVLETKVTVIAERTPPLDAFRTGVYALCQYYLNGAISKEDVKPLFEKLIEAFTSTQVVANKKAAAQ